jgi:two-component system, cell cycle sensor histidine kinase PleC
MLINEILDLSRIEAGRFDLKEEAVALAHVVAECRRLLALRAKKRQVTFEQAVAPDLPKIWADERAIRQIVLNLLSNAIKFTPHAGTIKIKIGWTASGGQYVAVSDNGPGNVAIWTPFARAEKRRRRLRPRSSHRKGPRRTARRILHPEIQA